MAKVQANAFAEATEGDDTTNPGVEERDEGTPPPEEGTEEQHEETPPGDERLAHEEEGTEEEEQRQEGEGGPPQRPRLTSKQKREARKRRQQALRAENMFLANQVQSLMQRLGAIETGQGDSRLAILDSDLKRCSDEVATADRVYVAALDAANKGTPGSAEDVLQAQRFREQSQARLTQLTNERKRLEDSLAQARANPTPPLPVPGNAQADRLEAEFRADRPWLQFDPQSRPLNIESGVARTVGIAMRAQGFDPATPAYWTEMEKRLKGALPHMFEGEEAEEDEEGGDEQEEADEQSPSRQQQAQQQQQQQRPANRDRGPPVGRSGRNAGANRESVIPAEVVSALKDAGMWDDPKERADALKYYRIAGTVK